MLRIRYRPSPETLRGHTLDRLIQAARPKGGQDPAIHPRHGGSLLDWCRAAGIGHLVNPAEVVAKRYPKPLDTRPHSPIGLTRRALRTLHERGIVDRVGLTDRYRPSRRARG